MVHEKVRVILNERDFLAIEKPAGVLVHRPLIRSRRRPTTEDETIADWVRRRFPETAEVGDNPMERPGIVHRLDRETSGVLVVAKTQGFFEHLKGLFQRHEVRKTYLALVWGGPPRRGVIDKPIGLKPGTTKHSTVARRMKMVKSAVTEYETVWTREHAGAVFSLVRLFPKTGRTHQIRVHLASIGHPVVGDTLYSRREDPWKLGRQFLHAESVEFTAADGKRIRVAADLPPELDTVIKSLNPDA